MAQVRKISISLLAFVCLVCLTFFAGCEKQQAADANIYQIYMLNNEETKVEAHGYEMLATEREDMLEELITAMSTPPDKLEYKAPFAMGFQVLSVDIADGRIFLNVDTAYSSLPATTEVLVRAAVVRTLTQLPGVRYVQVTVDGKQLYDNTGNAVGLMTADLFIDNDGNEINTYELARVKLYFATAAGDKLVSAYREKYYSTNMPMERFVLEELIAGPSGKVDGLYPTINPEVKVISVTTQDGVCYVNLDAGFLTMVNNVSTEISIYSIVNSLSELSNVNRVQILVNGEVPASFASSVYERNLDYVTTLEK